MFCINGRFSWPVVLVIAYATIVIVGTDFAWRMVQAPIKIIAGCGLVLLLLGVAAILIAGPRFRTR